MLLLGLIPRPTKDLDLVAVLDGGTYKRADPMPPALARAVIDVAKVYRVDEHWMNAAPSSLMDFGLPAGFLERTEHRVYGGLELRLATRLDQIALKLYACVDQGPDSKHAADLRLLAPTAEELRSAASWARGHDPSEGFRSILVQVLEHFGVRDAGTV